MFIKSYMFVKCEVINAKFFNKDLHSVNWGINHPSKIQLPVFYPDPPVKFANCPPLPRIKKIDTFEIFNF